MSGAVGLKVRSLSCPGHPSAQPPALPAHSLPRCHQPSSRAKWEERGWAHGQARRQAGGSQGDHGGPPGFPKRLGDQRTPRVFVRSWEASPGDSTWAGRTGTAGWRDVAARVLCSSGACEFSEVAAPWVGRLWEVGSSLTFPRSWDVREQGEGWPCPGRQECPAPALPHPSRARFPPEGGEISGPRKWLVLVW